MKTYPLFSDDKQYAFEIENTYISLFQVKLFLSKHPEVSEVRSKKLFQATDDRMWFIFKDTEYVLHEPFGDNSRFWIGPVNEKETSLVFEVEKIFKEFTPKILIKKWLILAFIIIPLWGYFLQDNNYEWSRIDHESRILVDPSGSLYIDSFVVEFEENRKFAVALRQIARSFECKEGTIATEISDQFEYWISSKEKKNLEGPFSYDNYLKRLKELNILNEFHLSSDEEAQEIYEDKILKLRDCTVIKEI